MMPRQRFTHQSKQDNCSAIHQLNDVATKIDGINIISFTENKYLGAILNKKKTHMELESKNGREKGYNDSMVVP